MSQPKPTLAWFVNGTKLTSYDFGLLSAGTKRQEFILTNLGGSASASLMVTLALASSSAGFTKTADNCTGSSLGPRKSCSVKVRYTFTAAGQADTATLTATGHKTGVSSSITLTGRSAGSRCTGPWTVTPGQCLGNLNGINFYVYFFTGSHGTQTFTLTNNGTTTMSTGWFSRNMTGLDLISQNCGGAVVPPGQSCQLTFSFTAVSCPLAIGFANYRFQGNGGIVQLADLQISGPCS
jgi:hypothetical protein